MAKRKMRCLCIDLESLTRDEGKKLRKTLDEMENVIYWEQDILIEE